MRWIIGCEVSGVLRDALIARGEDAVSCDLLPSDRPGPHIQGDVRDHLDDGWDAGVFFPTCTDLAVSGAHRFKDKQDTQPYAIQFFLQLACAPIPKVAVENPIGIMSTYFRKPDQIIQPYQFGHPESKRTCLWLRGFPLLVPTNILPLPACGYWENQTPSGQNKLGPSPNRAKIRSQTYQGIANAMADQWRA